jgi:succinate dehydrogenase / fumarate reductase iron-sulfur subunit
MSRTLNLRLKVWRQPGPNQPGKFVEYDAPGMNEHMSFLEMLDVLNGRLVTKGEEAIAFDHDCREGICGMCGMMINGKPHGGFKGTTTCQLHMRHFQDGQTIHIEPWRATAFPVLKDLVVDRSAFDAIVQAGGYISVRTGSAPEANQVPVPKRDADASMDAAACIACGACVAACPNASASLFTAAKLSHLNLLPQGQPEKLDRVRRMVGQMDAEGFGHCTNHYECEAACPKDIPVKFIAKMNRDFYEAMLKAPDAIPAPKKKCNPLGGVPE